MQSLINTNAHIEEFCEIFEGKITKKYYPSNPSGRKSDGIIYITEGSMRYTFSDGKVLDALAGNLLFLPCRSVYSMELLSHEYKFIAVNFNFSIKTIASEVFNIQSTKVVYSLFSRMLEKWRQKKIAAREDCMSILYSIYAEIIRHANASYVPISKRKKLDNAIQYISENYSNDNLTVDDIAKNAHMSESNFRRVFKSVYNISPVKYLTLIRLDRAKGTYLPHVRPSFGNCGEHGLFKSILFQPNI